jgi:hypothetical protein
MNVVKPALSEATSNLENRNGFFGANGHAGFTSQAVRWIRDNCLVIFYSKYVRWANIHAFSALFAFFVVNLWQEH